MHRYRAKKDIRKRYENVTIYVMTPRVLRDMTMDSLSVILLMKCMYPFVLIYGTPSSILSFSRWYITVG